MENDGQSQQEQQAGQLGVPDKIFELLPTPPRYKEVEPEVLLWRAVIDRALKDVLEGNWWANQSKGWLRGVKSPDEEGAAQIAGFIVACDLACLDPHWVRNWIDDFLTKRGMSL